MAEEFVYITHSGTSAVGGPVTRQAFDEVWSEKGWKVTEVDFETDDQGNSRPIPKRSRAATAEKGK